MIIRKKLTPEEISPSRIRTNPDTGEVEQTFDGGLTWVDAPELDPRTATTNRAPPIMSAAPQCDAAASMVQALHDQVNVSAEALSAGALFTASLALGLAFIPGFGLLFDVIIAFSGLVFALGASVIAAAFTPEVYGGILCILLANVDSEGQLDDAALTIVQDAIDAAYPGTVATLFDGWIGAIGINGINNAGALGAVTGDCSSCLTCVDFLGGDGLGDLVVLFGTTYDSGGDFLLGDNFGATMYASFSYTGTEDMVSLDITVNRENQSGALGTLDVYAMVGDDFGTLVPLYNVGGLGNGEGNTHIGFTMPGGYDQLYVSPGATGAGTQLCTITKVSVCSS